jgi:peroxiredoxin
MDIISAFGTHKLAVLFAVPGAFTPTCSTKHLPGFIDNAKKLTEKGVEAVYCMSVNDRFVMKAWGKATDGFMTSGIKLIADGNGDLAAALNLTKDVTGSRMGIRSQRFAMILEYGKVKAVFVDEKGLDKTSAESILAALGTV